MFEMSNVNINKQNRWIINSYQLKQNKIRSIHLKNPFPSFGKLKNKSAWFSNTSGLD